MQQDGALFCVLDEPDAQGFERNAECFRKSTEQVQVDVLTCDPLTQHIARHQKIAGKFICLALDNTCAFQTEMHSGLVAVEGAPLSSVQHEVSELMRDRKSPTLRA